MRNRFLIVGLCSVLGLLIWPNPAQAAHSWGYFHWARTTNPFTIQLGDNVDGRWDVALYTAAGDWSASRVLETPVVPGATRPSSCRGTIGRVEVCNANYGNTGWLGIASIATSDGVHINSGTVLLNDYYFDYPPYNTAEWRASVTCQEIGHVLGLDHQDENVNNPNLGSCMDYTNLPASNQRPNLHDYQQLETIYAHADRTTTVGTSPGYAQPFRSTGYNWGRHIDGSWDSGNSTYWRYLGGARGLLTFVTWA